MKKQLLMTVLGFGLGPLAADEGNPAIDYVGFRNLAVELEPRRLERRIDEAEFIRMAAEKDTVVLDVRSRDKYEKLHVAGAVHLNFSDFSDAALAKLIPSKATRILIYCNNNFENEPELFVTKSFNVALNIQTFINLHAYGYGNVYELKPLLDIRKTEIRFEGSEALKDRGN